MVDAVVSFVIERLGDYVIRESVLLSGVKDEVELLKKDLEWMHSFIQDAENKQLENPMILRWISDIRDIAYDSEDVLDKFMVQVHDGAASNMTKVDEEETSERRGGLFNSIMKFCRTFDIRSKGKQRVNLYAISKKIEKLQKRLNDVSRRRELFGLENVINRMEGESSLGRLKQLRRTTSFEHNEIKVVGYEDDAYKLLAKLLENDSGRFIISIFGPGGLGKTTLARKLYHNDIVKSKFNHRAWVSVSQDYKTHDLLLRIIKSFHFKTKKATEKMSEGDLERYLHGALEKMSEEDLARYLHRSLQGHSYLVVIDDVWHKEAWKSLRRAFPDNNNGSRVIVTTRIKDVAEHSDEKTYVHPLRFLRTDESWQLFCENAFQNSSVDEGLEKLGREMVQKCGGLPLAIVVLGGLLSMKEPQQWRLLRNHIWKNLRSDSIEISYLLALSFNDLPYHLKLCFLYLGHFPEDYEIETEQLIQLWVAEGFISSNDEKMEDVAKDNLNELINRSLIQIDKISWGRIETCRVHDLLRDLAIEKAKELSFMNIFDEINYLVCSSMISSCRRQAVYSGREKHLWLHQCSPLFRSLLFFDVHRETSVITKDLQTICLRFRLLRVLNLQNCCIAGLTLPKDVVKLIHLKYLGLRNTHIRHLPPSIVNLLSLQTLDLFTPGFYLQPPTEICKLKELRHIIGNFTSRHLQIDILTKLQTLKYIHGDTWSSQINPEKFINLRELHISGNNLEQKVFTFDSIAKLRSLQILSIEIQSGDYSFSSLQALCHCSQLLHLSLHGKMEHLPENLHDILPNLECLSLQRSYLTDDPMFILGKLMYLMILELGSHSYCGKKLVSLAKDFPRLETLLLRVRTVEEWYVEEGALPKLRGLSIRENSKLKIPERLTSIPLPHQELQTENSKLPVLNKNLSPTVMRLCNVVCFSILPLFVFCVAFSFNYFCPLNIYVLYIKRSVHIH